MRHRKSGRQLNRNSSHRKAMFSNMAASLIESEVIKTTLPKAKELRRVVEPLITLAKEDSVANRRLAFSRMRSKSAVGKLFTEFGPRYQDRPGGYTRILKCGFRTGDAAPMAYIELVGRPIVAEELDEDYANAQALPAAAFTVNDLPPPVVIPDGVNICRIEHLALCRDVVTYMAGVRKEALDRAAKLEWLRGQVEVYGAAAE